LPKGFNTSKFKSQMRQAQRKAEQQMKSEINKAQRKAEQKTKQQLNAAVRKYERDVNREIRKYNANAKRNQQIINRELSKLNQTSHISTGYTTSLNAMQQIYQSVGAMYGEGVYITPRQDTVLDLIEQEHANSLITANAIENNETPEENTEDLEIGNKLMLVSQDLNNRWNGAVYALNPNNPDAARHFCTSCRELFTDFIELKAPDADVFAYNPNCERTERGNATRREKIRYMMCNLEFDDSVIDFADADITNILELFHVLSNATHGPAGKYSVNQLLQVKRRVEQGINFLCAISV